MNTIETLPKTFTLDNVDYSLQMYITTWNRICLGYVNMTNPHESICYVVVEPDNECKDIQFYSPDQAYGVAVSLDDAANMLKDFVETRYMNYKNYKTKNFWEWVSTLKRKTGD